MTVRNRTGEDRAGRLRKAVRNAVLTMLVFRAPWTPASPVLVEVLGELRDRGLAVDEESGWRPTEAGQVALEDLEERVGG